MKTLTSVDPVGWLTNVKSLRQFYGQFGDRLPGQISQSLDDLERGLKGMTFK